MRLYWPTQAQIFSLSLSQVFVPTECLPVRLRGQRDVSTTLQIVRAKANYHHRLGESRSTKLRTLQSRNLCTATLLCLALYQHRAKLIFRPPPLAKRATPGRRGKVLALPTLPFIVAFYFNVQGCTKRPFPGCVNMRYTGLH